MPLKFSRQLDATDCAATCLKMVASYYGKTYSTSYLNKMCYKNKTGTSLLNLKDLAEYLGFRAVGAHLTPDRLQSDDLLPCILFWNQKHFVVLHKIEKNKVVVADPAQGILKYTKESFVKCWTGHIPAENKPGVVLLLKPTQAFFEKEEPSTKPVRIRVLFSYILPYRSHLLRILAGLVIAGIIGTTLPFLTQLIVDNGIQSKNIQFVVYILLAQIFLTFGQTVNNFIQNWLLLHVTTRISVTLVSDFLGKLMKLKISFFDSKLIGDIIHRINDFERIEKFLTSSVISMVTVVVTFLIFGNVIFNYSGRVLIVFLGGSLLYLLWITLFLKKRAEIDYMRFQESSTHYSNIIQLISGIQDIKLNHCEKKKRWEWEKIQIRLQMITLKGLWLSQSQEIGATFIEKTKNVLISFITVSAVIEGDLSLGMLFAIQFAIGQLNIPLYQSIELIQAWQDVKLSLSRINEIYTKEEEETSGIQEIDGDRQDIEIKNVCFRYGGPSSPHILDQLNLCIPHHKTTAIVGPSGSGKTTLLKLLLGYYDPTEGDIFLGEKSMKMYDKTKWRDRCSIVMQEGFIFSDTLAGNIGLSDECPNINRIKMAAKIANIDDFIESLPMKYDTLVGDEGQNLSTGQKQRILIARAIYKNATYVFLDEATNSLDATNERSIMEKLGVYLKNKTVFIIAHRLSTVKQADQIVVLENGRIVEVGTHGALTARKGNYYHLIKDQLELGN